VGKKVRVRTIHAEGPTADDRAAVMPRTGARHNQERAVNAGTERAHRSQRSAENVPVPRGNRK
jgi:hypothetical protein